MGTMRNEKGLERNTYADGVLEVHLVGGEDGNGTNRCEFLVLLLLGVVGTGTECGARVVGSMLLQVGESQNERLVVERDEG
jgi:hypothetical protein